MLNNRITLALFCAFPFLHASVAIGQDTSLPTAFDWRNVDGVNWLTPIRNQHVPHQCGACAIMASAAMLSDRIKIQSNMAQSPEVMLSAQVIKNCANPISCHNPVDDDEEEYLNLQGASNIFKYMMTNGVPDETCSPWLAADMECSAATSCYLCFNDDHTNTTCSIISDYEQWYVSSYGSLPMDNKDAWRREIRANGPIHCSIKVTDDLRDYKPGDIWMGIDGKPGKVHGHAVVLVGWGAAESGAGGEGESSSTPYWIVRNSWGAPWGDRGFFKLVADERSDSTFSACDFATPSTLPAAGTAALF